ncbi:type I-E CRISPR-associated protein Cas7/Cse4/CasC [Mixta theicola]|uniref:Type I-E CRISPR-associated protein Cas7/Cse4/CasC n=1 Tax=Mixta theicola TaxID=1458355 RepID=A0A2K1Q9A2_9GAMM|nr:type I-E CRISPR-associated protein Cas7/Cse4/CasC [Mixta theicola]PNS11603.1 type I-E CRISPR-associated protein Cas7/Cse4/CasC [Mixta theicola]GLR08695.1 Cse4 family CRISPR-associated protein [Mixta theicola]
MTTFIQLHLLTAYAPANLNRDDAGRPKTAFMGGVERLRVSSQSLKRAWRCSETFEDTMGGYIGKRTRRIGIEYVYQPMTDAGVAEKMASAAAEKIAAQFGSLKKDKNASSVEKKLEIEQIVHVSRYEIDLIKQLVDVLIAEQRTPGEEEVKLLRKEQRSVDMALFGRMLASSPEFNVEAACQVSHALGVSAVTIEDDFFTAVDDLNKKEDAGSAHMGEQGFASALFYTYICISRDLLIKNLGGDEELAKRVIAALTETALTVSPTGKQNSFASRAYASYALAEIGQRQPRSLAAAFFQPVREADQIPAAIVRLKHQRESFEHAYGKCTDAHQELNVPEGQGTLAELLAFVSQ